MLLEKYIPRIQSIAPLTVLAALLAMVSVHSLQAQESAGHALDIGTMKPSSDQVTYKKSEQSDAPGVNVTIAPGSENYPGLALAPTDGEFIDLSEYGHVEATIENTGASKMQVSMRVDNPGHWKDSPWNTESTTIAPGETKSIKVIFGYAYGKKPSFKLDPAKVTQILFFTTKAKSEPKEFRIESIVAAGPAGEKPPVNPSSIRTVPPKGILLGSGAVIYPEQVSTKDGAEAKLNEEGTALDVTFPKSKKDHRVILKPSVGKWDLRDFVAVAISIENTGSTPVTPRARLGSRPGSTDTFTPSEPIAPGAKGYITVSFVPKTPWTGVKGSTKTEWNGQKGTGTRFDSNDVDAVVILADSEKEAQSMRITSIMAGVPTRSVPEWVGKRPPVEGDWKMTFNEDFDGDEIDLTRWNIYTPNYWDKRSHFSKDNVIVSNGVCRLRFEKNRGHHNDDPNEKATDYATGFLDTYGKWVQRYGYFEARMKLPEAPGLWPAFWLMPDRGIDAGPQWKRQDSAKGGMEFDIMEFLSGWGPYRYNIAMHWDGYGKHHKQTGSTNIYFEPDSEGYITAGLLWTPGEAVFYANGEVVGRWESPRISDVESDIMFTHVSGGWDNNSIDDGTLPSDFIIDYVRVWQRADLASEVDGVQSKEPTPAAPTEVASAN